MIHTAAYPTDMPPKTIRRSYRSGKTGKSREFDWSGRVREKQKIGNRGK